MNNNMNIIDYKKHFLHKYFNNKMKVSFLNNVIKHSSDILNNNLKLKKNEKINLLLKRYNLNFPLKCKFNKPKQIYSVEQCQNQRKTFEDRYLCQSFNDFTLYAVLDGHGGTLCVDFIVHYFFKYFLIYYYYYNKSIEYIIRYTILELHSSFISKCKDDYSGTTLCFILFHKDNYYIGNLGDSKCLVVSKFNVEHITKCHYPDDPKEKKLIMKKGGFVRNNRILGKWVNISRTIGDKHVQQYLSHYCDIHYDKINKLKNKYIVLTSDGLYESIGFPDNQLINIINNKKSIKSKCKEIIKIAKTYSRDNLTLLIIKL